ncbi:MAG: hypothetical protein U0491_02330 [Candidatus Saccharimonadales bacterium]
MPQSLNQIHFKKNTATAVLLVVTASIVVWIIFNALFDAYPTQPTSYQAKPSTPTTTVVEPLDYHYDNDNF